MNIITIAGNLGKDVEVRYLPNGDAVGNFSIADNQGKDKPAIFWNCSIFGKRAESLSTYLKKGQSVTVSGNVTEREWTDKEGNKRKQYDVRVVDLALQGGQRQQSDEPTKHRRNDEPKSSRPAPVTSDMDDDIPW